MRAVVSLAWARLRHRPARWLLVALGVAAATVLPVPAQATATVVAAQALRYGVEALPAGDRAWPRSGTGCASRRPTIAALDATARHALAPLGRRPGAGPDAHPVHLRPSAARFYFGAVDGLAGRVRLTEGRLPTSCTPTRCEVVVVGAGDARRRPRPRAGRRRPGGAHRPAAASPARSIPGDGAPLLLADGVAAAAQLESLSAFQRSYAWVTPVDLDRVQRPRRRRLPAPSSTRRASSSTGARLSLTAPDEVLRAEADRAPRSARRFALLGGAATALLLGFAAIGAIGLRRDHAATVELLRRRGASRRPDRRADRRSRPWCRCSPGRCSGSVARWTAGRAAQARGGRAAGRGGRRSPRSGGGCRRSASARWRPRSSSRSRSSPASADDRPGPPGAAVDVTIGGRRRSSPRSRWPAGAVTAEALGAGTDPLLLALPVIVVVCGGLRSAGSGRW